MSLADTAKRVFPIVGTAEVSTSNPMPVTATASAPGATTIATGQITVAVTATLIVAARTARKRLVIVNHGATAVYVGGAAVATTTGLLLAGVAGTTMTLETAAAVYGIVGSGTQAVSYVEEYS